MNFIKKLAFYSISIFLVSLFLISGCKKADEEAIGKWIVGTWNIDLYVQQDYEDGVITSESESPDQGQIVFRDDGTGTDIGGNFNGSDFTYENTDTKLILTAGQTVTEYVVESFSTSEFVFSITETNGTDMSVERWYMSK
ncbi:MAG: hypothetical protein ACQERS_12015 [Bacteroidota bacterium]